MTGWVSIAGPAANAEPGLKSSIVTPPAISAKILSVTSNMIRSKHSECHLRQRGTRKANFSKGQEK
jgi:hypothetical protein